MTKTKLAAQWRKLQADYKKADDALEALKTEAHLKWGPQGEQWASAGIKKKIQAARKRADKVGQRMYDWLEKHSPWDFASGVSTWWIKSKLTAEQALSDVAPTLPGESAARGVLSVDRPATRRTVPTYDERGVVRHVPWGQTVAPQFTRQL